MVRPVLFALIAVFSLAIVSLSFANGLESNTVYVAKFNDLNRNGVWDAVGSASLNGGVGPAVVGPDDEPVLAGWTIYVDRNDNGSLDSGEPTDETNSEGWATITITGITPGTYKVREVGQPGWTCSAASGGTALESYKVREVGQSGRTHSATTPCYVSIPIPNSGEVVLFGNWFTTAPTAVTGPATLITETGATINGTVNPNGAETAYHFEYGVDQGTATTYTTPGVNPPNLPAGTADDAVQANVSGLTPKTNYRYRVVAENMGRSASGAEKTFTTLSKCVSRRRFRIRIMQRRGKKYISAAVYVNKKRVAVRKRRRLTALVNLRGLPKGKFLVKIVVKTADGHRLTAKRRYRTCSHKRFPSKKHKL